MAIVNKERKKQLVTQLYRYRVDNQLTLKQLADELELPLSTISNWFQEANYPSDIAAGIIEKFLIAKGCL